MTLVGCDASAARASAERVRAAVEALGTPNTACALGIVSISIGVATFARNLRARTGELVDAADAALYEAKRTGRNRVEAAPLGVRQPGSPRPA